MGLDRLIKKELEMLRPNVNGHPEVEIEEAPSESYGVTTKYVRTIFTAHVGSDLQLETCCLPPWHRDDVLSKMDFFSPSGYQSGSNEAPVYAWMSSEDFGCLAKANVV